MSNIDLMILGMLFDKPMNAYEMNKVIKEKKIKSWVKISDQSIYKKLIVLKNSDYLDSTVIKEGVMPEKIVYSINKNGKDFFFNTMAVYSKKPQKVYIDFIAFISNLRHVEGNKRREMIDDFQLTLSSELQDINDALEKKEKKDDFSYEILDLYKKMYTLFSEWSIQLLKD